MIQIDHTCIKKGNYIVTFEPNDNPPPVNPEIDSPDYEPDYPQEIDYPDYDSDYGYFDENRDCYWNTEAVDSEIDPQLYNHDIAQPIGIVEDQQLTSNSVEDQIIQNNSVDSEIDSTDFDFEVIIAETRKDIAESKFLDKFAYYMDLLKVSRYELDSFLDYEFDFNNPENLEIKVLDTKVFERLFELYCPDTGFVIPAQTNLHLREYLDRLELDGRYLPKKQLNLFGEV